LFAGFDSRSVEAHIQVDEHTDRYAASLCSIGEKFGSGLGVDTDGERAPKFDTSSGEFAESLEPILADCGIGKEERRVGTEHAFPFANFCRGQASGTMGYLSTGHLHGLVRFRVWTQLEIVLIAVRLHPVKVFFDDCRIDDQ
jgi:hypothetical protein